MRNLKKVISSVAALAIVASSASAFAVSFPDVETSASYSGAVQALTALGVINGDDNGLFNPDNQVTRAEFTKMAVEALGEGDAATSQTTSQFTDAANTTVHWAAGYIAQGVSDKFINGYDDTTFGPDDQVTYAQACKMLVAAIGYSTYAENQGGWPSGYVAQATTLGITAGVSATNDTNLTRAQVATLIYNAMDVPLCVIKEWESNVNYATGEIINTPVLEKLDGKSDRDYQTLLTDRHDAYKVKGRVTVTSKGGASTLEKGEVEYSVEAYDNFDDILKSDNKGVLSRTVKVGDTNAADMLFEYTEAIIQKDNDADEYTLLAIESYGNSKTVTIAADDVADDDSTIKKDYAGHGKLPVYKSSTSSSTTKYDLEDTVRIYVNGVEDARTEIEKEVNGVTKKVSWTLNDKIEKYILENSTGTVTLVDVTKEGSTATNGKYDYIMVDYYVDAVVDYTSSSATYNRIYFKQAQNGATGLKWAPDDADLDMTITKDGQEIDFTDLQEYDVLSIAYDVVTNAGKNIDELDYYNILVSSNQVTGAVTGKDTADDTVKINGSDYDLNTKMVTAESDFELSTEYTIYLDVFGYVAYRDEGNSEKNYGVIVAMYKSAGNDNPTVRLITSDAEVVAYECKNGEEANKFYSYATTSKDPTEEGATIVPYGDYNDDGTSGFTKSEISGNIKDGKTVCTYTIASGKIKFKDAYPADSKGGSGLEYKASSTKLGNYTLNESTTKIIDMDSYMNGKNASTVSTYPISNFEDGATYKAYAYDKNNNGDYRFLILFGGTSTIRPESTIAVVKKTVGTTEVDSTTCTELMVGRSGSDEVSVLVYGEGTYTEGSVIAYTVGSDGYVEDGDLYVLYTPDSSYDDLFASTVGDNGFSETLTKKYITKTEDKGTKYAITYTDEDKKAVNDHTASKDVYAYVGVVYKKSASNFELILNQENGISSVDTTSFTIDSATNVYTFDYNEKANKGTRLTAGNSATQQTSVFNPAYCTSVGGVDKENDKNFISWSFAKAEDVNPQIAFVKEVEGDVTDVVFYVAP